MVPPGLETLRLTTGDAIDQYLRIYLRLPVGPRRLGPLARIFDYVAAAAPGVREILVIGKVGWEVRTGEWDEVVVDGPATGHVIELLDAPRTMADLVSAGPIAEQTGWLREILASDRTDVVVVTSPDDLTVTETGELIDRLRTQTETGPGLVVVNRVPPTVDPAGRQEAARLGRDGGGSPGGVLGALVAIAVDRDRTAEAEIERLHSLIAADGDAAPVPSIRVPDAPDDPIGAVARAIDATDPGAAPPG